jgi:hypothetical protein
LLLLWAFLIGQQGHFRHGAKQLLKLRRQNLCVRVLAYVNVYEHAYVDAYGVYVCLYVYAYAYVHVYVYAHVSVLVCVCMCMCMFMCMWHTYVKRGTCHMHVLHATCTQGLSIVACV